MVDTLFDHEDEKWLQEQQMLHNIQSNYCRELMDSIQLQFAFLDEKKILPTYLHNPNLYKYAMYLINVSCPKNVFWDY